MNIILDKKDIREAKRLGFTPKFFLGTTVVEVPGTAIAHLQTIHFRIEAEKDRQKQEKLMQDREVKADDKFEAYNFGKEGVTIEDHDGWETDGPNRLIKKIYYLPDDGKEHDSSEMGSFIVDFKEGSVKVVEAYANL